MIWYSACFTPSCLSFLFFPSLIVLVVLTQCGKINKYLSLHSNLKVAIACHCTIWIFGRKSIKYCNKGSCSILHVITPDVNFHGCIQ